SSLLPPRPPAPQSPLFPYTTLFRSPFLHPPHPVCLLSHQRCKSLKAHWSSCPAPMAQELKAHSCATYTPVPADGTNQSAARNCADRKSTRLNSSHVSISYAVFCLKK